MNTTVISSTFFLTLLLMVGLFFFIRASVKDRTQQIQFLSPGGEDSLLPQLQQYFSQRAYQVSAVDKEKNLVQFQGNVRPSLFLAIFLSFLSACGLLCLGFVLSLLYPSLAVLVVILPFLAPFAGVFYWKKAGRVENVFLKFEATERQPPSNTFKGDLLTQSTPTLITVTGHRDELMELQKFLDFQR